MTSERLAADGQLLVLQLAITTSAPIWLTGCCNCGRRGMKSLAEAACAQPLPTGLGSCGCAASP